MYHYTFFLAVLLQKERVHKMRSWRDLQQRLAGPSRFCFGLFHANLPHQPLAFLEAYLTTYANITMHDYTYIMSPIEKETTDLHSSRVHLR
jgi:hypothetical protein